MQHVVPMERVVGIDGARGLSSGEVAEQRQRHGRNDIVEVPQGRWRALAVETAKDPMLWFLIGTGCVYAALGEWTEAIVLLVSILPLAGMDVFLHQRTQASTRTLRGQLATRARVLRDGLEIEVASEELVVGDLALVRAGDPFPADGIVLEVEDCQADESSLTGEAVPVRKRALETWPAGTDEVALDGEHWGFAGTRVLTGRARLRVVFVGGETLYGGIVRTAGVGAGERTPLQSSIATLVRGLVIAAVVLCATLALVRLRQGHGLGDALLSAMTLAIAALPEEFPVVFTVFLGVGVHRLARRRALVRRALCVENIGRVSTICSDKTGTITEGVLKLVEVLPAGAMAREELLATAARASRRDAHDPLDQAVLDASPVRDGERVSRLFPFTEDRRRETAVIEGTDGHHAATKGSPETVLAVCDLADDERRRWLQLVEDRAAHGRKVIAVASRQLGAVWAGGEPDRGYRFEGLLAFEDPPRAGAAEAVSECRSAGVRTIMLTGDHPATALAIARAIGLTASEPRWLLGERLEAELERDPSLVSRLDVVARALPAQKLALVRALRAAGESVAVTGDGVNDVPALQAADVGIAMGARGTRAAREVASIVLLDDNFATIVRAIAEGRQLLRNLRASFAYLLMIHVPLVLAAAIIPLAGYPLVFLPIHVVWLELVIHPTAMLAFQVLPPSTRLTRLDVRKTQVLFGLRDWISVLGCGALLTAGVVFAYDRGLGQGYQVEHARGIVLVTLILASTVVMAISSRMRTRAAWVVGLLALASAVVAPQIASVAAKLHVAPLHVDDWALAVGIVALACVPLALAEWVATRRAKAD